MSPVRILIIGVLLYIGYRLIFGGKSGKSSNKPSGGKLDGTEAVEDVLMEDPVCKSLVPKQQAVKHEHEGKTYYFCSEKCCNQFVAEKGKGAEK